LLAHWRLDEQHARCVPSPPCGGGVGRGRDQAIFTYSNSPGLLSMPTLGGAIQPANLPGSYCGCIRLSMEARASAEGRKESRRCAQSASERTLPSASAWMSENSPM